MTRWTNKSVLKFAGEQDPINLIEKKARDVVIKAINKGWSGPPYDPIALASILGIPIVAKSDIKEARTVPDKSHKAGFIIEFNPNRPRARIRYSIAHEIAHTFFPDCSEKIRNRGLRENHSSDHWQLETLCNIAAAELVMPIGSFFELRDEQLDINHLMDLRREHDVSAEAILIRSAKLASHKCAAFAASKITSGSHKGKYKLDYVISNEDWIGKVKRGTILPSETILNDCSAIGYTAKAYGEVWGDRKLDVESVGLPTYLGDTSVRVAGIIMPAEHSGTYKPDIEEVYGDALNPRGEGAKIIAHIVNNKTPNWGGKGFAVAVRRSFPEVQEDFKEWAKNSPQNFRLGNVHITELENITFVHMIAQKNYGASASLEYEALESCLEKLANIAREKGTSIHMPRIGSGESGGRWGIVREYILEKLSNNNIPVTIYNWARSKTPSNQDSLFSVVNG